MDKQSKFNQIFNEPVSMGDCGYALSAELYPTEYEAAAVFSAYLEEQVSPDDLERSAVRYSIPPADVEWDRSDGACWWGGATGRGAKPIWWYEE